MIFAWTCVSTYDDEYAFVLWFILLFNHDLCTMLLT
jgi:hypothetical protein